MILPLPKVSLILSIGLISVVNSSTVSTASSDEGYRITRTSAFYHFGQVRPIEGDPAASVPGAYGHRYVPGQNQPLLTRMTTDTTLNSQTVAARQVSSPLTYPSYAPFVYDLNATATTLTTRTGARSSIGSVAYKFSSTAPPGATSTTPAFESITIISAQPSSPGIQLGSTQGVASQIIASIMSTISILMSTPTIGGSLAVQSSLLTTNSASVTATGLADGPAASSGIISELASLTGVPWTLPPCNGPSPGPGLTPVGCTFASSKSTPLPTTTYTWSEIVNITVPTTTSSPTNLSAPNSNHSQAWTSDSVPCPGNSSYECVVNGTSTITLGLISQILRLGAATGTPVSPPGTENLPPNWANNITRCAGNTNIACLVISSSTTTLGPIAQTSGVGGASATPMLLLGNVNGSQSWTSNSTPCANDSTWECVDTPSGVVSLAPIASLKNTEFSTSDSTPCANNKSLECVVNGSSTITPGLISMLTAVPFSSTSEISTDAGLLSTLLSELGISRHSSTTISSVAVASSSDTMSTSSLAYPSNIISSTSTSGGQTTTTSISLPPSPTQCASNSSMECLVNGDSTFTAEPSQKMSSKSTSGVVTVTSVTTTSLPSSSSESMPSPPYPYPSVRVQSGSAKSLKIPLFFTLFCSLISMANSIGLSVFKDPPSSASSSSADIYYSPLVSSIQEILSGSSSEPDGDWGIGVPPASTSSFQQNGQYGGGQPTSPGTTSTPYNNGQYGGGGGGQSKSPSATTAAASATHAVILASTSFLVFPTNFIQPVTEANTGSASGSSQTTSSSPVSSTTAKSSSSKLKAPLLILFLCSLVSLGAATMTPRFIPLATSMQSGPSLILPSPGPCALNSNFECVVQGGSTITLGSINPLVTVPSPTPAGPRTCVANPTLECIVQGGNTITVGTISSLPAGSSSTRAGPSPCAANTFLGCVVQGGNTFTVGPIPPQSTLTAASTSQSTVSTRSPQSTLMTGSTIQTASGASASTSKPAKSGAFKVKIPFLLLLLCSLTSLVTASKIPSPRGIKVSSNANPMFSTWDLSALPIAPTTTAAASSSQYPTIIPSFSDTNPRFSSWNLSNLTAPPTTSVAASSTMSLISVPDGGQMPYMTPCASNTRLGCVVSGGQTFTMEPISASTTLQTTPSAASTTIVPAASTKLVPSKTATSSSSRVKFPSIFVLLSFVSQAMAQSGRSATTLTITQQPTLTSAIHLGSPIIVSSDQAMPVMPATNGGPGGLKSIAAPFLVLIICCVAAMFYSVGLGRRKDRQGDEGYDSGWVVQRGECVDREHQESKDH